MKPKHNRVYLDYNIYDMIAKGKIIYKKDEQTDIFFSVAHVEEYFKALSNASSEDMNNLYKTQNELLNISKKNTILEPTTTCIRAKNEDFDTCLKRITYYDTREVIEQDGKYLDASYKKNVAELHQTDRLSINNSNIDYEKIWDRPEIKQKIADFPEFYNSYDRDSRKKLLHVYGTSTYLKIPKTNLPKNFVLKKNCFSIDVPPFHLLEMVIEYLNHCLCECGYKKDKDTKKVQSSIHDVSHMIYATYCNYFVTNDVRLAMRANAIYYYLGISTKAIGISDANILTLSEGTMDC